MLPVTFVSGFLIIAFMVITILIDITEKGYD